MEISGGTGGSNWVRAQGGLGDGRSSACSKLLLRRDLHDLNFKELGSVFPIRDVLQPLEFPFCFLRCSICVFYPTYYDRALKALERHSLRVDEIIKKSHAKFTHESSSLFSDQGRSLGLCFIWPETDVDSRLASDCGLDPHPGDDRPAPAIAQGAAGNHIITI
jgi:hypothetical protein